MRLRLHRRYISLLSLCLLLASLSAYAAKPAKAKDKKKIVRLTNPVPDALVKVSIRHRDLPVSAEAVNPNSKDYLIREGIDVSHYQGTIDWDRVASDGSIGYVYIKATEGESLVDDMYEYNVNEARRVGIKVGSYHFFRGNASLEMQLNNLTSVVKRNKQDLVPLIDVEHAGGLSKDELVSRLKEFVTAVSRYYGCKPIIYTYQNFYNRYLQGGEFNNYPLMIASYHDNQPQLNDDRQYNMWQYTSHGSVSGIRGRTDRSKVMEGFSIADLYF